MPTETRPLILVVDDEPDVCAVLSARLEACGFATETAASGKEALHRIRSRAPDLILLDLMLPGIDGWGLCGIIKRDHRFADIPIVIVSARFQSNDRHTSRVLGASAYIVKPFRSEDLVEKIRELLPAGTDAGSPVPNWDGKETPNERVNAPEVAS